MVFIFLISFATFSLDNILLIVFGLLTCFGVARVYVFTTLLTSRSHKHRTRHSPYKHNLRAFHRKLMLLSHVMLLPWFISTYLRHCTVIGCTDFLNPNRDQTSRLRHLLGISTFPRCTFGTGTRLSYLDDLRAYAAHPSKSSRTLHLDSDSFDICVDTGASATCTMSKNDFVPGTYQKLKGFSINGISSGLRVLGHGTV